MWKSVRQCFGMRQPSRPAPAPGQQTGSRPAAAPSGSNGRVSASSTTPPVPSHVSHVVILQQQRAQIIANILHMSLQDQSAVIGAMEDADAADLLQQMNNPPQASRILVELSKDAPSQAEAILQNMKDDSQVAKIAGRVVESVAFEKASFADKVVMIEAMEPRQAGRILDSLPPEKVVPILRQLSSKSDPDRPLAPPNSQIILSAMADGAHKTRVQAALIKSDFSTRNEATAPSQGRNRTDASSGGGTDGHQPGPSLPDTIEVLSPLGRASWPSPPTDQSAPAANANLHGQTANELAPVGAPAASDGGAGSHETAHRTARWQAVNDTVTDTGDGPRLPPRLNLLD